MRNMTSEEQKKMKYLNLLERLEDEDLGPEVDNDEVAFQLRQHYGFVDTIIGRVTAGDDSVPLWLFQKAQILQKTR